MKKITLILLLLIAFNTNAQKRTNCVTTVVEKVNESPDPDTYLNCTVYAPDVEFLKK